MSGRSVSKDPLATPYTYQYGAGLGYDGGELIRPRVNVTLAAAGTSVVTPQAGRAFLQTDIHGTIRMNMQVYAYYGLSGEIREGRTELGATAGVRVSF